MILKSYFFKVFSGIILFLIMSFNTVKGQNLKGITYSNYAGTNGLYQNPAVIADSRHKLFINIATADLHASNSFVKYNAPFSMLSLARKIAAGEEGAFSNQYLEGKIDGDRKILTTGLDVRGPSAMYAIDDYNSIALTTRIRSGFQINNMSEAVARLFVLGADAGELQDIDFFRKRFDLNINTFSEVGLSFASTLVDNGTNLFKAGVTVKRLGGIFSSHVINNEATYQINEDPEDPENNLINIESLKGNYGYVAPFDNSNIYKIHNWFTGSGMTGSGFGLDAGFIYESRSVSRSYTYQMDGKTYKDNTFNKYNYRVGISLIDLGGIRYKGEHVNNYDLNVQNLNVSVQDLDGAQNAEELNQKIDGILGQEVKTNKFRSGLPTAINLNVDVKVNENLYVTTVWMPGLRSASAVAMRHNSFVAVVPRYETKNLEFSLPVSLSDNYHNFTAGAMARIGPVFIGSDNITGLLNIGNPHGFNIYTGLTIPIANKKLKDGDMDGISDKLDKCPNEKGLLKHNGCPDMDQDGIPDYADNCPEAFGPKSNKGCPQVKQVKDHKEIQLSKEETRVMQETYNNLEFETASAEIIPGSTTSLDKLAELLLKRPGYKLLIEGHTDNTGLPENNMILSIDRANAVKDYLIEKGVSPEIIIAEGYGAEKPIADNDTEEGRRINRRVEFTIIQ